MPDLSALVMSAADYKLMIDIPVAAGGFRSFVLITADTFTYEIQEESETVNAIGTRNPIAEVSNAKSNKGTMQIQAGEGNAILLATGLNDMTQIKGSTVALTGLKGGFARVFTNFNINSERLQIRAKDKQTMMQMDWAALGVNNA